MFGIPNPVGTLIDVATDKLGLPEPLGDAIKIGVGVVTSNPALIADGISDIAPDVLGFVADELGLGDAEPGEPGGDSHLKHLVDFGLELLQRELQRASARPALLPAR